MRYYSEYLRKVLGRILDNPITIVRAGSGYGKSTAIIDCFLKHMAGELEALWTV